MSAPLDLLMTASNAQSALRARGDSAELPEGNVFEQLLEQLEALSDLPEPAAPLPGSEVAAIGVAPPAGGRPELPSPELGPAAPRDALLLASLGRAPGVHEQAAEIERQLLAEVRLGRRAGPAESAASRSGAEPLGGGMVGRAPAPVAAEQAVLSVAVSATLESAAGPMRSAMSAAMNSATPGRRPEPAPAPRAARAAEVSARPASLSALHDGLLAGVRPQSDRSETRAASGDASEAASAPRAREEAHGIARRLERSDAIERFERFERLEQAGGSTPAATRSSDAGAARPGPVLESVVTSLPLDGGRASSTARDVPVASGPAEVAVPARVEWLASRGGGTAQLVLHPAELGEVEIQVRVRGAAVDVSIQTHEPLARAALLDVRDQLGESLAARELRIESLEIRMAEPTGSHSNDSGSATGRGPGTDRNGGNASSAGDDDQPGARSGAHEGATAEFVQAEAEPGSDSARLDLHI
jgi:hypothetical protein